MRILIVSGVVLLLAASSVLAEEAPKPAPELSQLKYFAGTWACTGNAPASPMGPAHKTESTLTFKSDLDGFWYTAVLAEKMTAENPHPVKAMGNLGFDTKGKQILALFVDSFGGWSTETSPGWQGDTMVWSGDQVMMGEKGGARDTFVKKGDGEFTHKFEVSMKDQWSVIVDETCKKAGAAKK
jgi:hypothetical protein